MIETPTDHRAARAAKVSEPGRIQDPPPSGPAGPLIVLAAAAGAALAPTVPTGTVADVVWRALFGGLVAAAGLRAAPWTWIVAAGITAVAAVGSGSALVLAAAALVVAVVGAIGFERIPLAGATAAGLAAQSLLRLPDAPRGVHVVVVAAAVTPLAVSAYRGLRPAARRTVRRVATWSAAALVVATVPALVALAIGWQRTDAADADAAIAATLAAGRQASQPDAIRELDRATDAFHAADAALAGPLAWSGRVVPVIGNQLAAASVGVHEGLAVTRAARAAADVATLDDLRLRAGTVDLAVLQAMTAPMDDVARAVGSAEQQVASIDRDRLVFPFDERVDRFADRLAEAREDTALATTALGVLPAMLGGEGERRYVVLFTSPSESRELGGFTGEYGELVAVGGTVQLVATGRATDLNATAGDLARGDPPPFDVAAYPERYRRYEPWRYWQNMTGTPDFPTVATMARDSYAWATGRPVDGVLAIDPIGLAALLELTGPVSVEGLDRPLGPNNAADFLLREQYERFVRRPERAELLGEAARATFDQLLRSELPGPAALTRALGPAVEAGRVRMWTFDPEQQALLVALGLDGTIGAPPAAGSGEALFVTTANAGANKLDAYLHRTVGYDATLDRATGELAATVTVELVNDPPPDLPEYVAGNILGLPAGTNRTLVSLYTSSSVEGASIDGRPVPLESYQEYGLTRVGRFVDLAPQQRVTMTFHLRTTVDADRFDLTLWAPPAVNVDRYAVSVRDETGAPFELPSNFELTGRRRLVVDGDVSNH